MTRRSKPKRARYAYLDTVPQSAPPYLTMLSIELWHCVFSYCQPPALLAVRDTCHVFRNVVDANNGILLAHSPLLLPHPPPDPRKYMRFLKHGLQRSALGRFFDIRNPWQPGLYGSAAYTMTLFRKGECYMCRKRTDGPPTWMPSKIYICSKRCRYHFFRSKVAFLLPKYKYRPRYTLKLDRHIWPWLPNMTRARRPRDNSRWAVPLRDLRNARREYRSEVMTAPTPMEQMRLESALFKRYSVRRHEITAVDGFQYHLDEWRMKMEITARKTGSANSHRLRNMARDRGIAPAMVAENHGVDKTLLMRTRNLRSITSSSLTKAGLLDPYSKYMKCQHCDDFIFAEWVDWHIMKCHPGYLPLSRVSKETGCAEYRCKLCDNRSVTYYSPKSLHAHQYHKHGVQEHER
ncbi:hypothetical protein BD626DRAFT_452675 [Schizophyllum amplum]|uniref:F-box domain-containing protein n=1 Tax=Schizophyllum amplum TaxID=97359 RepID=A0A550CQY7_9AGAR|nr:hypothetical protein BD626DRAFT_452675 [Auriculariopsis ampla]